MRKPSDRPGNRRSGLDRRRFLGYMGLAGLAASPLSGCLPPDQRTVTPTSQTFENDLDSDWIPFDHIFASGTPLEIGRTVGKETGHLIRASMGERRGWFEDLKRFALADRVNRLEGFVTSAEYYVPEVVQELRGMAEGSGVPLEDIYILNLKPELGALKAEIEGDACSTIHLISKNENLLLHNEDGHEAYHRRMIVLHAKPKDAPHFVSLVYPGMIGGSVPFMNDKGLFMSTNFIGVKDVNVSGVPRYFLGRAVLGKKSIDEAVEFVTKKIIDRAYSFHLNLGSFVEKRLVSVDTAPFAFDVQETKGLFLQTNHFVLPATKGLDQPNYTPGSSTDSRYRTLNRLMKGLTAPERVTEKQLVSLLSSHEATHQPYSPCRHPTDDALSRTLATAVFDLNRETFFIYEGNPCEGRRTQLSFGQSSLRDLVPSRPWRAS